jgi:hypothetical protein
MGPRLPSTSSTTMSSDENPQPTTGRRQRESALHVGARKKPCVPPSEVLLCANGLVHEAAYLILLFTTDATSAVQYTPWPMCRSCSRTVSSVWANLQTSRMNRSPLSWLLHLRIVFPPVTSQQRAKGTTRVPADDPDDSWSRTSLDDQL